MPAIYRKKRRDQTFPVARMHFCADGPVQKNAVKFFKYWSELSPEQADLASIKIYRTWPIVDLTLSEPGRTRRDWATIQGPITFKPENYIEWFLETYGSGEWKCILNEAQVHDSIIECAFSAMDPTGKLPQVDLKTVIWGNFKNDSFRLMLKNQNISIPGENPEQEAAEQQAKEEEDVNTTAVEALAKTNEQLMNRLDKQQEQPTRIEGPMDYAAKASVDLIGDAAKQMIASAGQGLNPSEMMDSSVKTIKAISELLPKADNTPMTQVIQMMADMQNKNLERSERALDRYHELELEKIKASAVLKTETAVAVQQPKGIVEQLNEYKAMVEAVEMISGKRRKHTDDDDEPKKPGFMDVIVGNAPALMTGAVTLTGLLANMLHNWSVGRTREGHPEPPNGAARPQQMQTSQPPMQQQSPFQMLANHMAQNPNLPAELHQWIPLMIKLEKPFLAHFTGADTNGYTFAEHIQNEGSGGATTPTGRTDYMTIREQLGPKIADGKVTAFPMLTLLQAQPNLWPHLANVPRQLETFLTEFFKYDEMMAAEAEEEKVQ
jgi:hypothetical protein